MRETHYEMTLDEYRKAVNGEYVDPDRYRKGHRDYSPEMLCRTGDAHARGTRIKARVDCPACLDALQRQPSTFTPEPGSYEDRIRQRLGEDEVDLLLRRIEPGGVVFVVTRHHTRSGRRVFLPIVFYRHENEPPSPLDTVPARDRFTLGKSLCQALGWRWDSRHTGWIEEPGGGQSALNAVREISRVLFGNPDNLTATEI